MLLISSVNCCLATKPSSLVMFAAVDSLGKKSMSMSTIDKTDLITKSIFDTLIPISVLASPFLPQGLAVIFSHRQVYVKRERRTLFLLPKVKVEFRHLFPLQKRFSLCSYHNINANIVVFCWLTVYSGITLVFKFQAVWTTSYHTHFRFIRT